MTVPAHKWEYRIVSCDTSRDINEEQRVLDAMGESSWECFHVERRSASEVVFYFKRGVGY